MKQLSALLIVFAAMSLWSCSSGTSEEAAILATINEYRLTAEDFKAQLTEHMNLDAGFKLDAATSKDFLEQIIRKELLIQEAVKRKLDRNEKFIKAIERYWEAALIRNLMDLKTQETAQGVVVSQEEIREYYQKLAKESVMPPFADMEPVLREDLLERKKTRAIDQWINDLRTNANIKINQELLSKTL